MYTDVQEGYTRYLAWCKLAKIPARCRLNFRDYSHQFVSFQRPATDVAVNCDVDRR